MGITVAMRKPILMAPIMVIIVSDAEDHGLMVNQRFEPLQGYADRPDLTLLLLAFDWSEPLPIHRHQICEKPFLNRLVPIPKHQPASLHFQIE